MPGNQLTLLCCLEGSTPEDRGFYCFCLMATQDQIRPIRLIRGKKRRPEEWVVIYVYLSPCCQWDLLTECILRVNTILAAVHRAMSATKSRFTFT